jgi:hypothetical protein
MNNVNAPADLEEYAAEHDVDLDAYRTALAELKALGRFVDPEPPLAEAVLAHLRLGAPIEEAVSAAREAALATLRSTE